MTSLKGRFPFCRRPFGVTGPGTNYPVGFFAADLWDLYANIKMLTMDATGIGDNVISGAEAFGSASGTLIGMGITLGLYSSAFSQGIGGAGTSYRYVDKEKCMGVVHVIAQNNCILNIDMSDVVRDPNGLIYYPKMLCMFFASGSLFTSKIDGTNSDSIGGIDFQNSAGIISMFVSGGAGSLEEYVFGEIKVTERYDDVDFTPKSAGPNATVTIAPDAGKPFTFGDPSYNNTVSKVLFGDTPAKSFAVGADKKSMTATAPDKCPFEPIFIQTSKGDEFALRQPFKLLT